MRNLIRRLNLALCKIDESYLLTEQSIQLTDAELCLMYALDDEQPHSQKEVAAEWMIPRTTVNTITKRWEKEGYLIQTPVPGKRREMQIALTKMGQEYVKGYLNVIYAAEEKALQETLERYPREFVDAVEYFGHRLKAALNESEQ